MDSLPLAAVVANVESRSRLWALRFERGWMDHPFPLPLLQGIASANYASLDTARMIAATSWGAYQLMGYSLYNRPEFKLGGWGYGFAGPVGAYLVSSAEQETAFRSFTLFRQINFTPREIIDDPHKALLFALHYNGPGNVDDYAARLVREAKRQLGVPT